MRQFCDGSLTRENGLIVQVKGQGIYAFVTLVEGAKPSEQLKNEIKAAVRKEIGSFAVPDVIQWAPGLPKTRSGKIMRRILRKIAANQFDELVSLFFWDVLPAHGMNVCLSASLVSLNSKDRQCLETCIVILSDACAG